MSEPLLHNTSNPITVGIQRESGPHGSRIRKVISGAGPSRHPDWNASDEPRHWTYWRREAHVYEEGRQNTFADGGIRGPALIDLVDHGDPVELVLEDVNGASGAALGQDALVEAGRALGRAQGRLAQQDWERPWTSRGFLRDYIASKHVRRPALRDPKCWDHPLVRDTWPTGLQEGLQRLDGQRDALVRVALEQPRTLCHLDFWSHNLIRVADGFCVIDWACCGDGALGEDVSNLAIEAVLDLFLPPEDLEATGEALLAAYIEGAAEAGFHDADAIRTGFLAAAVKWCWLGPLHLERARTGEHHLYGGIDDLQPERQYRARGLALAQIVAWADSARV